MHSRRLINFSSMLSWEFWESLSVFCDSVGRSPDEHWTFRGRNEEEFTRVMSGNRLIKEARRAAATSLTLEDKLASQKQIKNVEALRNEKRRSLFEAQDAIDQQREDLIGTIEGKLTQILNAMPLFTIRFNLQ